MMELGDLGERGNWFKAGKRIGRADFTPSRVPLAPAFLLLRDLEKLGCIP
jgi:hypothetical protein